MNEETIKYALLILLPFGVRQGNATAIMECSNVANREALSHLHIETMIIEFFDKR